MPAARPVAGGIQRSHPLAVGLKAAFFFNEGLRPVEKVTGNLRLAPSSSVSFSELGLHATATDLGAEATAPSWVQVGVPHTIAVFFTYRATPDVNGYLFGVVHNNADGNPWQSTGFSADGSVNVQWVGNNGGSFTGLSSGVSAASLVNKPTVAVATITGSARKIYLDGVEKGSTTGISAPTYGASALLAAGDYTGVSRNTAAVIHAGYIWDRELTVSEIRDLSADPYVLAESQPRRFYVEEVVAPSTDTSRFFALF